MRRFALLLPLLFASAVVAAPAPLPKPVRKPEAEKPVTFHGRSTGEAPRYFPPVLRFGLVPAPPLPEPKPDQSQ